MISIQRTNSENKHFKALVAQLDADLKERDGEDHAFALYTKNGYLTTTNYGQYEGVTNSICFQKSIAK